MKKMKRLAALFLAVVMIMAMGMTAMAAPGDGSTGTTITIEKALKGANYTAYKIFNVVKGTDDAVSYRRPNTATPLPETELFNPVVGATDTYYNVDEEKMSANALATYMKGNIKDTAATYALGEPLTAKATNKDDNNTATFENVADGYYFIVNDKTANIAILQAVSGVPITITEKNQTSDWGEGGGKFARNAEGATEEDHFYAIGDTIYYEVVYKNAYNYNTVVTKEGDKETTTTEKVYQYVVEDEMKKGLSLKTDTLKVEVKEAGATEYTKLNPGTDGTRGTYEEKKKGIDGFKIVIPWAATKNPTIIVNEDDNDAFYGAPTEIRITYAATVVADVEAGVAVTNAASIRPNEVSKSATNTKTVDVYTGSLKIQKYDSSNDATAYAEAVALPGATFKIYKKVTENEKEVEKYLDYGADGKIIWVDEADAEEFTTTKENKGILEIKGLDLGTYYAKETVAPAGYNLLAAPVTMTISGTVGTDGKLVTDTAHLVDTQDVGNSTGAVLPSTGGIGTTIFYVVGGILVLGAAVLLITKKRMSARN